MEYISVALADTIMGRYPDPRSIPYREWCYVQGYILAGFEKLFESTREPRYFDYIAKFADSQVDAEGGVPAFTGESLDDMMAGTAIVAAYAGTGEERYRSAASRIRRAFDDYPRNSDGAFWHGKHLPHEAWIDGAFMGQVFLARYGAAIGERESCFDEAVLQLGLAARRLEKGSSGLYLHAFDESRKASWADRETGLSPEVWSEGLGWYSLALAEILALIDPGHPGRKRLEGILRGLVDALSRAQDPVTGLWYQVVDKGGRPDNWHDSSGSAMFVYAIMRAGELGCADARTCRAVAERGYAGLRTKVKPGLDGLVDVHDACDGLGVQDGYEAYVGHPRVPNAREAVGSLLWASTIMEKPAPAHSPTGC